MEDKNLKAWTVIVGFVAVSLCAYGHFTSPYTKASFYTDYSQYFSKWECFHQNSNQSGENTNSTSPIQHNHDDSRSILKKMPKKVGNGYEACRAFKHFLRSLVDKLGVLDIDAGLRELNLNKLIRCPRLLHERTFLGVTLICSVISFAVVILFLCCSTRSNKAKGPGKWAEAGFNLLSGIALVAGVGMSGFFLIRITETCNGSEIIIPEFLDAIKKYQDYWHDESQRRKSLQFDNQKLIPRFYSFMKYSQNQNPTQSKSKREVQEDDIDSRNMSSRISKFSWTKRQWDGENSESTKTLRESGAMDELTLFLSSVGSVFNQERERSCEIHLKYYWKCAATVTGCVTAILYLIIFVRILKRAKTSDKNANIVVTQPVSS